MPFTLRDVFGDSPESRVMEVFVENPDCAFSLNEIMELAEVESGKVVFNYIKELIYNEIVYVYSHAGNIKIYKLNTNNRLSKTLVCWNTVMMSKWMRWLFEDL